MADINVQQARIAYLRAENAMLRAILRIRASVMFSEKLNVWCVTLAWGTRLRLDPAEWFRAVEEYQSRETMSWLKAKEMKHNG